MATAIPHPIVDALTSRWWVPVVRGVAAIAFGVLAIAMPAVSLLALILLWGAYALVDGISSLILAARGGPAVGSRGWLVFGGIVSIGAGIVAFAWPGITALVLLTVIAFWAVLRGVAEIAAAVRLRGRVEGTWLLATGGVLSIVFGAMLLAFPGQGALALLWVIGAYAVVLGILLVGWGVKLRQLAPGRRRPIPGAAAPSPA